jgi:hypothetical protein
VSMEKSDKKLISNLRKHLRQSEDPELVALAPHIAKGLSGVLYTFATLDEARKVSAPRGFRVKSIEVDGPEGPVKAANWLLAALIARMEADGEL